MGVKFLTGNWQAGRYAKWRKRHTDRRDLLDIEMVSVAAHENGVSGLNGTPSGSEAGLFHNRKTGMRAGMAIDIGKPKGR